MLNLIDIFILALVSLFIFRLRLKRFRDFAAKVPGVNGIPFFGSSLSFLGVQTDDMYQVGYKMSKAFMTNCKFWFGPILILVVKDPEDVKIVFHSEKCSHKPPFLYHVYSSYGVFTLNGDVHKMHRKSMIPLLGPTSLRPFLAMMNAKTVSFLKSFDSKLSANAIDISFQTMDFALDTSLLTLFKIDDIAEADRTELIENMERLQRSKTQILYKFWLRFGPIFKLSKIYKPYMERQKSTHKFVERIMAPMEKKYQENGDQPVVREDPTYLESFYNFRSTMNTDEVINLVLFFIYAIYDTTGKVMASVLLLLAMNPKEQEKVFDEIQSLMASEETELDEQCLNKMEYLDLVIKESMRLIPVALNLSRRVTDDVELTNYTVPSGTFLIIPLMEIHRDKNQWGEDADEFKPERFRSENIKNIHSYSYNPFARGSRMCPGNRYAWMMMRVFLSKFLMKYRVTTELKYEDLHFSTEMTTTIKQGFMVKVEKR